MKTLQELLDLRFGDIGAVPETLAGNEAIRRLAGRGVVRRFKPETAACGRARYAGCRGAIIPVEERPAAAGHSHRRGRRDPRPHQCALEGSGLDTGLPAPSRLPR